MNFRRWCRNLLVTGALLAIPLPGLAGYLSSIVPQGGNPADPTNFSGRTISVMDFGAKCDVVDVKQTPGSVAAGSNIFTTANSLILPTGVTSEPIVISGADTFNVPANVNGTLATIASPNGLTPQNGVTINQAVNDSGASNVIPSATVIVSVAPFTFSTTETTATGTTLNVSSTGNSSGHVAVGMTVSDSTLSTNIPANTTVVAILSSTSVQLSNAAVSAPGDAITFSNGFTLTLSHSASASASNDTISIAGATLGTTFSSPTSFTLNPQGTITGLSQVITGVSSTSGVSIGMTVTDSGSFLPTTPPLDTIISFVPNSSITLATAPTSGSASPVTLTIKGFQATLAKNANATVPTYVASQVPLGGVVSGGSGYTTGNIFSINDGNQAQSIAGTTLQVMTGVSGAPLVNSNANVYGQYVLPFLPANGFPTASNPIAVTSSGGATFELNYTATGQYSYGTDDSAALNLAMSGGFRLATTGTVTNTSTTVSSISSTAGVVVGMAINGAGIPNNAVVTAISSTSLTMSQPFSGTNGSEPITITGPNLPQGSDIWLPANRICGTTQALNMPVGNNSLRGWDWSTSEIEALGNIAPDPTTSLSYVIGRTNGAVTIGGGMRDLRVEGNKLATYACAVMGGENQFYGNVRCQDAITADWLCGYPPTGQTQINGTIFEHVLGLTDFNHFGPASLMSTSNFMTAKSCEGQQILNSYFNQGVIQIFDNQLDYNLYVGDIEEGILPYNPSYCVELTGHQTVIGNRCLNAGSAGIFLNGGQETVDDVFEQWQNAVPTSTTYGVLIANNVPGDLVEGVNTAGYLASGQPGPSTSAANVVYQSGVANPSTIVANNIGASYSAPPCTAQSGSLLPQGRLTLASSTPIMTGNSNAQSTIYYAPYIGSCISISTTGTTPIPYQFTSSPSDTVGLTLPLDSNTGHVGYQALGQLYDLFIGINDKNNIVLCSGPAWTSATARNVQVVQLNGIWTNASSATCRYSASVANYFTCPQYQCTYVGTMYATANGQTSFNPLPAAASGGPSSPNAGVYFWNAYNRVPVQITEQDNGTAWTCTTCNTWEPADVGVSSGGIFNNKIIIVDGLQQTPLSVIANQLLQNTSGPNPRIGIVFDSTSAAAANPAEQNNNDLISVSANAINPPLLGQHYVQAMQKAVVTGTANFNPNLSMTLSWQY